MALVLNDDETMLRETAEGFFRDKAPVSAWRGLRDKRNKDGFSRELWAEMADMGFSGVLISQEHGGVDMGFMAAGIIAEQMGRNLSASPFFSTSVLAASVLRHATQDQAGFWLPQMVAGQTIMALALDEGVKHDPDHISTRAEISGNGFRLNGSKSMVVDGHVADQIIVAAALEDDRIGFFMVDPKTEGVSVERVIMVDNRNAARLDLNNVALTADALIGSEDVGAEIMNSVINAGRACLSAELLGAGSQAFHLTLDYMKERKQFGRSIGEFQALQHRAAHLYSEIEIARSCVLAALTALDTHDPQAAFYCAMTKAKLGDVAKLAGLEGIQIHGGVGMTDEYDIGLYLKRIRVLQEVFGDGNYHLDKIATAQKY